NARAVDGAGETVVHGSIRIEAAQVGNELTVQQAQLAAHEDPAVRLDDQRIDEGRSAKADARREIGVERAVGVKPGNASADLAGQILKVSADKNFAVGLNGEAINDVIRARIEIRIERAVGVEAPDEIARLTGEICEGTTDKDFAVRLDSDGADVAAGVNAERVRDGEIDGERGVAADGGAVECGNE